VRAIFLPRNTARVCAATPTRTDTPQAEAWVINLAQHVDVRTGGADPTRAWALIAFFMALGVGVVLAGSWQ
jgi:hypothetical protein